MLPHCGKGALWAGIWGQDAGLAAIGDTVRYPDGLVTRATIKGGAHLVPGAVAVFEVLSPASGRVDRIVKVREYAAAQLRAGCRLSTGPLPLTDCPGM